MRWILVPSRGWFYLGCLAAMVALSAKAQAQEPFGEPTEPVAPPIASGSSEQEPDMRWYGSWSLATDSVALAFASLGLWGREPSFFLVGAGIYLIGAPFIHVEHHQPGRATGSLLLRAALPVLTGVIGYQMGVSTWTDDYTSDSHNDRMAAGFGGLVVGALAGGIVAAVIDDVLVAREPIRKSPGLGVAFVPTTRSATLALAGRF